MTSASKKAHKTSPDHDNTGWPKGIPYIIGNEGCERFSFYGMRAILTVYLVMLYKHTGLDHKMAGQEAAHVYHLFVAATYGFGLIGAMLAERLLGKYRTILWLSIVYCLGHGALAIFENNLQGTFLGLGLIAVGSGGIKPCVSAHVGDQFGRQFFLTVWCQDDRGWAERLCVFQHPCPIKRLAARDFNNRPAICLGKRRARTALLEQLGQHAQESRND